MWRSSGPYDSRGWGGKAGKGGKDGKGGGKAQQHSWYSNGGKGGNASKGWAKGGRGRKLQRGEFDWDSAVPLDEAPQILPTVTYSYSKSSSSCDVLCPAWSVRRLQPFPAEGGIDLSLARGLAALQLADGGFELTTELTAVLGLQEPGGALDLAEDPDAHVFGALLALKAMRAYQGERPSSALGAVYAQAEHLACQHLDVAPEALGQALDAVGAAAEPPPGLPACVAEVLAANYAAPGRWSFFELWTWLLPESSLEALRAEGGVLCPRFFLVDLASAPLSPYDVDKAYPLLRQGACTFVGQPPDHAGSYDAMRQGRQLEAALCSFAWLEEDHVLTEVLLPGARAVFSAAPDAVMEDVVEGEGVAAEPLVAGDDMGYEEAGYYLEQEFPFPSDKYERCRVWRGSHAPVPPESYVEVKKTTHLNGRPGQFKLLKFWLQAALMRCGAVVVATTEGSADGDTACNVQKFSLDDLTGYVEAGRVWGVLSRMLQHVLAETSACDGAWTLRVQKAHGPYTPVRFSFSQGWEGGVCSDEPVSMMERFAALALGSLEGAGAGAEGAIDEEL